MIIIMFNSCGNKQDDSKDIAEEQNDEKFDSRAAEKDAQFYVDLASANLAELELIALAQEKTTSNEIKELAKHMEKDHQQMGDELSSLAASKGISIPAETPEKDKERITKLREEEITDFDRKLINKFKDDHEETLKLLEKISDKTEDPELKALADKSIPTVRMHLNMVEEHRDKMKDNNETDEKNIKTIK